MRASAVLAIVNSLLLGLLALPLHLLDQFFRTVLDQLAVLALIDSGPLGEAVCLGVSIVHTNRLGNQVAKNGVVSTDLEYPSPSRCRTCDILA